MYTTDDLKRAQDGVVRCLTEAGRAAPGTATRRDRMESALRWEVTEARVRAAMCLGCVEVEFLVGEDEPAQLSEAA